MIEKKTIYKLIGSNREFGFEVTVTDEGVEVETNSGLGVEDFCTCMTDVIASIKEDYQL